MQADEESAAVVGDERVEKDMTFLLKLRDAVLAALNKRALRRTCEVLSRLRSKSVYRIRNGFIKIVKPQASFVDIVSCLLVHLASRK